MLFSLLLAASVQMTAAADTLQAASVTADRGVVVSRTDTVFISQLADASLPLLSIPGLQVGDYGGLSGLKSVSLRGLGSSHTAIYWDGVRVGNIQSGQADLGLLPADNLSAAVVDYAQNSVCFHSRKPIFRDGREVAGQARISGGSFSTFLPLARIDVRLPGRLSLSAYASGILTQGHRPNADIQQIRSGADLFGNTDAGEFQAKIYFNGAGRGTPGSLSYPSADDRQRDRNFLAQGTLRHRFSPLYELHLSAKGSFDKLEYLSAWGDSDYRQTEFQLNSAHRFFINRNWSTSLSADLQWDGIKGNVYEGQRLGTIISGAASYSGRIFMANLALEYNGSFDQGASSWNSFSPSADVRVPLTDGLAITAFARRSFRAPTFNELYYPGYGNPDLKPEKALMADLGLDWNHRAGVLSIGMKADAFFTDYTDKIISAPTDDPWVWLPFNVGKARSYGADILATMRCETEGWNIGGSLRYGWQHAVDKTPGSSSYDQQLPFLARHSVVMSADLAKDGWSAAAVLHLRSGRRSGSAPMADWHRMDMNLGKDFSLRDGLLLGVSFQLQNLLNVQNELVSDYPMPGRSIMGGMHIRF